MTNEVIKFCTHHQVFCESTDANHCSNKCPFLLVSTGIVSDMFYFTTEEVNELKMKHIMELKQEANLIEQYRKNKNLLNKKQYGR